MVIPFRLVAGFALCRDNDEFSLFV